MDLPIKAKDIGNLTRAYEYADGRIEHWVGGTRSWRNNNPGNIRDYNIPWQGLIGADSDKFCIFNSYEMGKRALVRDITTKSKRGLSLEQIIYIYAPPNENDTEGYIRSVSRQTGIDRNTRVITVPHKIPAIADAMEKHEDYREGKVVKNIEGGNNHKKAGGYIWRTQGDGKVRSSHALRDGQIFSWDNPPEGGHPGEAPGCRCTAEPLVDEEKNKKIAQQLGGSFFT